MNFKASDAGSCAFLKKQKDGRLVLWLYVDDSLLASNSENMKIEFFKCQQKEFKVTVKPVTYFVGLEIQTDLNVIVKVNQSTYAKNLLAKFGMREGTVI